VDVRGRLDDGHGGDRPLESRDPDELLRTVGRVRPLRARSKDERRRRVLASLDEDSQPDAGKRDQRKDELPQPHFSTHGHYQAGFGLDSPRL
jgi:hypothetical protein